MKIHAADPGGALNAGTTIKDYLLEGKIDLEGDLRKDNLAELEALLDERIDFQLSYLADVDIAANEELAGLPR